MEHSLRCILICKSELEIEHQLDADVLFLLENVWQYGVRVVNFEPMSQAEEDLEMSMRNALEQAGHTQEDSLLIAARDNTLRAGDKLGMAVIAMKNPSIPNQTYEGAEILVEGFEEVDFFFLERMYQRKHRIPWRVIDTERCYLREMTLEDLDGLYEIYAQDGMTDYVEPLYERKEEEAYTQAYIDNMYRYYGYGMWLVFDRFTDQMIGRAGLNNQEIEGEIVLEMGYLIRTEYQGQGYATEVCEAILEYAKEALDFTEVSCMVDPHNQKSIHFLKKMNFQEGKEVVLDGKKMKRYVYFL